MLSEMAMTWASWSGVDEREKRLALARSDFWASLNEGQRQSFLREANWQEIRVVPEAKLAFLGGLISLEEISDHLGLSDVEIFLLVSTRQMPVGALHGGVWRFDRNNVDRWVLQSGGLEAVRADVKAQIAKQRAGVQTTSPSGPG